MWVPEVFLLKMHVHNECKAASYKINYHTQNYLVYSLPSKMYVRPLPSGPTMFISRGKPSLVQLAIQHETRRKHKTIILLTFERCKNGWLFPLRYKDTRCAGSVLHKPNVKQFYRFMFTAEVLIPLFEHILHTELKKDEYLQPRPSVAGAGGGHSECTVVQNTVQPKHNDDLLPDKRGSDTTNKGV